MRYFIVDTKELKAIYETNDYTFKVFGKQGLIPNNAKEVSFWKYVWFRFINGL